MRKFTCPGDQLGTQFCSFYSQAHPVAGISAEVAKKSTNDSTTNDVVNTAVKTCYTAVVVFLVIVRGWDIRPR